MRGRNYFRMGLILFAIVLTVGCTQADRLSIEDIWARPGNQDANSAVYFVVANTTGETDTLLSAESDIATAVELHESLMQNVDEGQGELAKPVEDEPNEHMEAHHQEAHHENGDMENHAHEDGENCVDHHAEGEHIDAHHEDSDMENHAHEDGENCVDHHSEGEHIDAHHEDSDMENHAHEDGENCVDHHAEGEHNDAHHEDGDMENHEHEDGEHCEDHNEEGEHIDAHHESEGNGNTMESSMDTNLAGGVMTMVQQENVPVGAQSQIEFSPGGLHVMLIGLNQDLNPGDTFQVTLNFENAGQITMDVPVREP